MVKVFISYSWEDKPFVRRLVRDLRKNKIGVWMDDCALKVGEPMFMKLHDEIMAADYLILALSKSSLVSKWVRVELAMAINKEIKAGKSFILPMMLEDCDLPIYLYDRKWADFRTNYNFGIQGLLHVIRRNEKRKRA